MLFLWDGIYKKQNRNNYCLIWFIKWNKQEISILIFGLNKIVIKNSQGILLIIIKYPYMNVLFSSSSLYDLHGPLEQISWSILFIQHPTWPICLTRSISLTRLTNEAHPTRLGCPTLLIHWFLWPCQLEWTRCVNSSIKSIGQEAWLG